MHQDLIQTLEVFIGNGQLQSAFHSEMFKTIFFLSKLLKRTHKENRMTRKENNSLLYEMFYKLEMFCLCACVCFWL